MRGKCGVAKRGRGQAPVTPPSNRNGVKGLARNKAGTVAGDHLVEQWHL